MRLGIWISDLGNGPPPGDESREGVELYTMICYPGGMNDNTRNERYPNVTIRLGDMQQEVISRKGEQYSMAQAAKKDLLNYYQLLSATLMDVEITEDEAHTLSLFCHPGDFLTAAHTSSFIDHLKRAANKHNINPSLISKLSTYTRGELWAIIDAIKRWHIADGSMDWVEIGLVKLDRAKS